ncbi:MULTISPECIES: 2-polyprenyl-3-methyl-6-methoxy-1,4-benzoquinone monooxygenase [unclassified Methylophaga]|jgi:ubiquinone biosynthesis monooxygenase Coq7|uniref:2-polyprenyl-3-methyl-6-methoxy-1,4-benzoquinone monooxygenase n=1 Tax=unclassified Methylophaga TaxID=2629249 RepID=UPI000C9504A2|nr:MULTISPECIES: 2-polyprenyl-3-methyl-6-methoxy-1,4-benzoquinone monooxygenase [unclassified Methylophaga]MAK68204.1 demethoxyubiquinone hydroxylase family protein [Methylophaga sp.]MAY16669.1 demethoxyubiquinone hydroxylase family protein [Methylophaga sp.]MBN46280.1 demethoxyubiquinone hydroxylase family protein [Methylophaga sp.]|tara:strand:- start:6480 stop:7124 length:645 start_codon:yes stop_codon:yes gene_type:complete
MSFRNLLLTDKVIIELDKALTTVLGAPPSSGRETPAMNIDDTPLNDSERRQSVALMRVNHAGEVSAQALYQGQALTAKLTNVREAMQQAAAEENDHLLWCEQRIHELDGRTSLLNPLWYVGSFMIGAVAGRIGDKWSLGFVAETEKQVIEHLDEHLDKMSEDDLRSRSILAQMREDERHHQDTALAAGGAELPWLVRKIMQPMSKVMTHSSYWL